MTKVLRMKDRVKLSIGDVEFKLRPLSYGVRRNLLGHTRTVDGQEVKDLGMVAYDYIKHSVVGVSGVKDHFGKDYRLEFDGDFLSDDSTSELYDVFSDEDLNTALWKIIGSGNNIPNDIEGAKIEIVEGNE